MTQAVGYLILAAVCSGLVGVLFRPHWAFVLVVLLYPLKQLLGAYLPIFVKISPLFNVMVFAAVVLAVLSRVIRRDRPTSGLANPFTMVTIMLYLWATLAVTWTPGNGLDRWLDGYAYWGMNVLLLPLALVTLEDFRKALLPLAVVGLATAILFYVNPNASWYSGRLTIYVAGRGSGEEIRGNPLAVGQMGGFIAVAAALMLPARGTLFINIVRIGTVLTGLGLALTSGSRAQALVAVGTIVLFYPLARRVKDAKQFFLAAGGMATVLGMIAVAFKLFLGRTAEQSNRWDLSRWSETIRVRVGEAMKLVQAYADSPQNWVQGLGTNAFSHVSGEPISYAHNAPVEMLCELGLIGFTLYCLAVLIIFWYSRAFFRGYADDKIGRATVAVLIALGFYSFALSLKQYTFVAMPEPWWLWILTVKIWMHEKRAASQYAVYEDAGPDHELDVPADHEDAMGVPV